MAKAKPNTVTAPEPEGVPVNFLSVAQQKVIIPPDTPATIGYLVTQAWLAGFNQGFALAQSEDFVAGLLAPAAEAA